MRFQACLNSTEHFRSISVAVKTITALLFAIAFCIEREAPAAPPQPSAKESVPASKMAVKTETGTKAAVQPSAEAISRTTGKPIPQIVALVNGQRISRDDLAQDCLRHYGKEVLETMVHKELIVQECKKQNISVTPKEVDDEINRQAATFSLPTEQYLKALKQERGISAVQFAEDIVWPTLAMKKIAGNSIAVSKEELKNEFESIYGPSVNVLLIAAKTKEKAEKIHEMAVKDPDNFGTIAKDYSEDAPSAAAKGRVNPIRMHGSYDNLNKAAFSMADGEISPVMEAGGQFIFVKRESLTPGQNVKIEEVASKLDESIRYRKLRTASDGIFKKLQGSAKLENIWNDPAKREKMPGVAATLNGEPIALRDLALECLDRYGAEVLESMVNRTLLEQDCKAKNITISEADMNSEIERAAMLAVKPKADGKPDVETWLKQITEEEKIPLDFYKRDVVWPSAALRKLAGGKVEVTDEDMRRGFESNFGERVQCRAIVCDSQRHAQEVFEKARKTNTSAFFGQLAQQYSVDPKSKAVGGEIPEIRRYSGMRKVEEEAFALKEGEISGIIQYSDKFVILRCEKIVPRQKVEFDAVKDEIQRDLFEKKIRLTMEDYFNDLIENAAVDNFLAGTSHSPKKAAAAPGSEPGSDSEAPNADIPKLKQIYGK